MENLQFEIFSRKRFTVGQMTITFFFGALAMGALIIAMQTARENKNHQPPTPTPENRYSYTISSVDFNQVINEYDGS